jgi:hypothetical protein
MERGARIIRTDRRIAASIRFSNARRHGRETADFATAIPPRLLPPSREGDIVDAIRKMKNSLCGGDVGQQALPMQRRSLLRRSRLFEPQNSSSKKLLIRRVGYSTFFFDRLGAMALD